MMGLHPMFYLYIACYTLILNVDAKTIRNQYIRKDVMYIIGGEDTNKGAWPWMTYIYGPVDQFKHGN